MWDEVLRSGCKVDTGRDCVGKFERLGESKLWPEYS